MRLLREYLDGQNNPDEPGWFIQWLQQREPIQAFTFEEPWFDIGTLESYLDAVAWQLDGANAVHPDAELENVTLGESVQIMADAKVANTTIDNSVVFPEAVIKDSELQRSIVDQQTHIDSLTLSNAVLGPYSQLNGSDQS